MGYNDYESGAPRGMGEDGAMAASKKREPSPVDGMRMPEPVSRGDWWNNYRTAKKIIYRLITQIMDTSAPVQALIEGHTSEDVATYMQKLGDAESPAFGEWLHAIWLMADENWDRLTENYAWVIITDLVANRKLIGARSFLTDMKLMLGEEGTRKAERHPARNIRAIVLPDSLTPEAELELREVAQSIAVAGEPPPIKIPDGPADKAQFAIKRAGKRKRLNRADSSAE